MLLARVYVRLGVDKAGRVPCLCVRGKNEEERCWERASLFEIYLAVSLGFGKTIVSLSF